MIGQGVGQEQFDKVCGGWNVQVPVKKFKDNAFQTQKVVIAKLYAEQNAAVRVDQPDQ